MKTDNDTGKTQYLHSVSLDKMIQPTLLLLIYKKPSHGYELIQNFKALDPAEIVEPGTIYRNLRRMESEGFVISSWETSESGPARRQYKITKRGIEVLKETVSRLEHQKKQIDEFLQIYRELEKGEDDQ